MAAASVVISCPLQSEDGIFKGSEFDRLFQKRYMDEYGYEEEFTRQHICSIHPSYAEITDFFSDAVIIGFNNCDIWFKYMVIQQKFPMSIFSGIMFYLFHKSKNNEPPFWGGIVKWCL